MEVDLLAQLRHERLASQDLGGGGERFARLVGRCRTASVKVTEPSGHGERS